MVTIVITKEKITVKTNGVELVYLTKETGYDEEEGPMEIEHKVVYQGSYCKVEKSVFPKFSLRKTYSYPYLVGAQNVEIIDKTA